MSLAPKNTPAIYSEGGAVLTAIADTDWVFDHWEGDYTGDDNPLTVTLEDDKTVTAVFQDTTPPTNPVPEWSTIALFGGGLLTIGGYLVFRRRRNRRAQYS